jgi:CDP-paratose 2-epimerase
MTGQERTQLVTGGAGFIGANLADRLLGQGADVTILDDLSRPGSAANLAWLQSRHGDVRHAGVDVADASALSEVVAGADVVYHLAGQTAVTTSVTAPRDDFAANALGTLNVLEAARLSSRDPVVVYASTNKVYGDLASLAVVEQDTRWAFRDLAGGVPESAPLDFNSPYACSKGAADQYALAYHRLYGVRTVVLRQSCIYGPRQLGHEEQGWLAWFVLAALDGTPITIFGDGKQVRDVLHVDDLLDAYQRAVTAIDRTAGRAYNIGGGPEQSVSVWAELGPLLQEELAIELAPSFAAWRPGDQRVFVADTSAAASDFGWRPSTTVRDGLRELVDWARAERAH